MYTALIVCHVIITVVMVVVVLLQSGKGGGLGAGFGGGGANTLFGSSGGSNFFTKLTMGLAGAFVVTSLALTAINAKSRKSSIFDQGNHAAPTATSAPASPEAAPAAPVNPKAETKAPEAAKPAGSTEQKK
jgi:preprotein translocase subunit SecG